MRVSSITPRHCLRTHSSPTWPSNPAGSAHRGGVGHPSPNVPRWGRGLRPTGQVSLCQSTSFLGTRDSQLGPRWDRVLRAPPTGSLSLGSEMQRECLVGGLHPALPSEDVPCLHGDTWHYPLAVPVACLVLNPTLAFSVSQHFQGLLSSPFVSLAFVPVPADLVI